jgi:alternate signal-mediated exported protein
MSTTTTKKGAVKGTVAAAAGVAVLLGGMGTFALWNVQGQIGETGSATGQLAATFGTAAWVDQTAGTANVGHTITDVSTFRLVPGDEIVGTVPVAVTAEGENLVVEPEVTYGTGFTLPTDVTATVELLDSSNQPVTQIKDTGSTPVSYKAVVTLKFADDAQGSMRAPVDLSEINVNLQQVGPDNQPES